MKRHATGVVLLVIGLAVSLFFTSTANAATQEGSLQGSYWFTAPGQSLSNAKPIGISMASAYCHFNADNADYNVGVGFGITGSPANSYNTYQGILLRKWAYCWAGNVAAAHSIIVGNGWCLNWHRYARVWYSDGYVDPFGIEVKSGNVQGSSLSGNVYRTLAGYSYAYTAYLC